MFRGFFMTAQFEHYQSVSHMPALRREDFVRLCVRYGQAYDALINTESEREVFYVPSLPAAVSFCRIGKDAEMLGGLCAPEEFKPQFLKAFVSFLEVEGLALSTFNAPEADIKQFNEFGFRSTKLGEELYLNLPEHTWGGKKYWKFRTKVNKCKRAGLVFKELTGRSYDHSIPELTKVTSQDLANKAQNKSLRFFVGECPPVSLGPRRVFAAEDLNGQIDAFVVLIPFKNGNAFGLDSFRTRPGGERNAMLFLLASVVELLKEEGIEEFSFGAVPGSGCKHPTPGEKPIIRKLVNFAYNHLSSIYDLKGVDEFKSQFRPQRRNLYISCYPDQFTLNGVYAFFKTFGMFNFNVRIAISRLTHKWVLKLKNKFSKPRRIYNGL